MSFLMFVETVSLTDLEQETSQRMGKISLSSPRQGGAKRVYFHTWLFKCGFWGSNPDPPVCTASTLSTEPAPWPARNPLCQNPPLPSEVNSFAISHDLYRGPSTALKQWDCLDALDLINGLKPAKL